MGTKQNPGAFDCHDAALPDEPMFVLLARDPRAPRLVRQWADQREVDIDRGVRPESDREQVREARQLAHEMECWRVQADGRWRR